MGRQLFLHHYLPAHLASALVTGALLEFIFNLDPDGLDVNFLSQVTGRPTSSSAANKKRLPANPAGGEVDRTGKRVVLPRKERVQGRAMIGLWAASGVVLAVVISGWYYFLPLTYGKPGLTPAEVNARKWLGYDLHFAK